MSRESIAAPARWARWGIVWLALLAGAVAGCGGGVGVGGTGSFASGPITGFGSVIVNGIHFDDSGASIESEEGTGLRRADLGLGMVAEVESSAIGGTATDPTATATRIRIASALVGPVTALDQTAGTLAVLQQPVRITATTVFAATLPDGFVSIADTDVLEVHGFYDAASATIVATRIERRLVAPLAYKLRGVVHDLDTGAGTFMIGAATFVYTSAPATFANGRYVLLAVETAQVGGRWVVRRIDDGRRDLPDLDRAEIRGAVTAFTSTRSFSVNGQPVDASAAAFPDGEAFGLGVEVEVRGTSSGGTLRADRVEIEQPGGGGGGDFDLRGPVSALQTAAQTFVVQGQTLDYSQATFDHGTVADLRDGAEVEVRADLAPGGTRLVARTVRFR